MENTQRKVVTDEGADYPIQPDDINTQAHFFNAFNHHETEISAGWIIRFLRARGRGWAPFSREELTTFYHQTFPQESFHFNRLIEPEMIPPSLARAFEGHLDPLIPAGGGWIVETTDGRLCVTDDFINRCHRSSPAQAEVPVK